MPNRRKTNEVRLLHGEEPRHHPNLGGGLGTPDAPSWMDRAAKREWRRAVRACADYPTWLQEVDRAALTAYCVAWSTFLQASQDLAERGVLVAGRSSADEARDALVKNPSVQIARDAQEQLRRWAQQLGFTPDARSKVDLGQRETDEDAANPFNPSRLLS